MRERSAILIGTRLALARVMDVVSRWLRRRFGLVLLALTAVAALLDARGLATLVGARLADGGDPTRAPPLAPLSVASSDHATSADALLRNNPFDSTTSLGEDATTVVADREPPSCEGYRPHIIVASDDPDWSFASLVAPGSPKSLLRRRGGSVGDREVAHVGVDRVWLRSQTGALCQAMLWRPPSPTPSTSGSIEVTPPVRKDPNAKPLDPAIAKGIVKFGPREYRVDRGTVDLIVEQYAELMKGTMVTPDKENGRVVGVRLFGIRPESVLGVLGLENGDRLMTINGYDLTDPSGAVQAMAYLRSAPRIDVVIQRGGRPTSILYDVR